jgi:hypothetical protein
VVEERANLTRASAAERMAERDRTAIRVHLAT